MNGLDAALREAFKRMADAVAAPADDAITRMLKHAEMLERWNKTHDLTSVDGAEAWAEALFADSWLIRALPGTMGLPIVDVGSGGGFPALVLLAGEPKRQALFFEKVEKKRSFLAMVIATVGYSQAMVAREPFPPGFSLPKGAQLFTSRATFAPEEWLGIAAGVARPGDSLVLQSSQEEPPELAVPWKRVALVEATLPFSQARRRLALFTLTGHDAA